MNSITKEQSNYIKLIAIITMFIDHMGYILFPNVLWLRVIGRIAFPLFAYQIAVGYSYTKSLKKYISRIFGLGVVCQVPYFYAMGGSDAKLNILFTLTIGIACIYFWDKKLYIGTLFIFVLTYVMQYMYGKELFDYGLYGILSIFIMYVCMNRAHILAPVFILINIIFINILKLNPIQIASVVAILFLIKPLKFKYNIPAWFFYLFYPAHLLILWGIGELIAIARG